MALSLLAIQDPLDFNGIENELEPSITCSDFLEDGGHNSTTWMMATSSSSLSGIQLDPATISIESTHSHPQNVWKTGALEDGIPPQHNGGHVPIQSTAEAAEQFAWVYATPDIDGNTGSWCESLEWLPPGDMFPEQETGVLDVLVHCHLDTRQQSVIEGAPDGLPLVDRLGRLNTWQLNLNKALSNNEKQGYGSLMVDSSPTVNALAGFGSGGGQADVASRQGSCEPEHSCGQELEGCSEMEEANNNYGGIGPNLLEVDKVDITSLSPRSIGYGDTADGHIGDSVQAAFVDGPTHVEFTPVASAGLQSCAPRDRRPQHWRRVVCRLFRALLKGPCVDRVWQVTMQGKDQTGSPMYLCNAFLMAVLGEEGGESSAPWPSKLELTDGIPGLMAYFARVLTWALGHVVDATTVEQVFDMSGATYKTKDDILTSAPLGIAPWCWSLPLDVTKIQVSGEMVSRRDAPLIVPMDSVGVAERAASAALARHVKPTKRRKKGKKAMPTW